MEEIVSFLRNLTDGRKQVTKHARYSHLKTLFNFIRQNLSPNLHNPCDAPMLKKLFRCGKPVQWDILEKETVDEIIFRTTKLRNRIMLELMARGGMRIGEVLKLAPKDIDEQKLTLRDPKSGKEEEVVFIPRRLAGRLRGLHRAERDPTKREDIPHNLQCGQGHVEKGRNAGRCPPEAP